MCFLVVEADLLGFGVGDEVAFGGFPGAVFNEPVDGSGCGVEDVVPPPVCLPVVVVLAHGDEVVGAGVSAFAVYDAVVTLCVLGVHGAVGAASGAVASLDKRADGICGDVGVGAAGFEVADDDRVGGSG